MLAAPACQTTVNFKNPVPCAQWHQCAIDELEMIQTEGKCPIVVGTGERACPCMLDALGRQELVCKTNAEMR